MFLILLTTLALAVAPLCSGESAALRHNTTKIHSISHTKQTFRDRLLQTGEIFQRKRKHKPPDIIFNQSSAALSSVAENRHQDSPDERDVQNPETPSDSGTTLEPTLAPARPYNSLPTSNPALTKLNPSVRPSLAPSLMLRPTLNPGLTEFGTWPKPSSSANPVPAYESSMNSSLTVALPTTSKDYCQQVVNRTSTLSDNKGNQQSDVIRYTYNLETKVTSNVSYDILPALERYMSDSFLALVFDECVTGGNSAGSVRRRLTEQTYVGRSRLWEVIRINMLPSDTLLLTETCTPSYESDLCSVVSGALTIYFTNTSSANITDQEQTDLDSFFVSRIRTSINDGMYNKAHPDIVNMTFRQDDGGTLKDGNNTIMNAPAPIINIRSYTVVGKRSYVWLTIGGVCTFILFGMCMAYRKYSLDTNKMKEVATVCARSSSDDDINDITINDQREVLSVDNMTNLEIDNRTLLSFEDNDEGTEEEEVFVNDGDGKSSLEYAIAVLFVAISCFIPTSVIETFFDSV